MGTSNGKDRYLKGSHRYVWVGASLRLFAFSAEVDTSRCGGRGGMVLFGKGFDIAAASILSNNETPG